ncbi:hypothetical protein [Zophobihabitans entericus]|uniref:Uncharacterized protein n=1 Tax=Zophobihabitans entericus TaxID=1635327 RepID=A0A6G9IAZ9_9GAMM|nr:hypothetical protein [Zophobihabitans entericus]QIQ21002.1 hypothetical protein IPMB12_04490 [Zophobihabitans entericus]
MKYLRWIAVFPCALLSSVLISGVFFYLQNFFYGDKGIGASIILECITSTLVGTVFIIIGIYIAPEHKDKTAKILFIVSCVLCAVLFVLNINLNQKLAAFYTIFTLLGSYYSYKMRNKKL